MASNRKVLTNPNFFALFKVQFLGAFNDNTLKNGLLVLLTFSGVTLFGLPEAQVVSISLFLFILPYFLFSSYAGKLADSYDKVKIIRIVKICELIIMIFVALGFYLHLVWLLMLALFVMGVHSAFFGPVKYSIVPQYIEASDIVMAIGYIEMGTFVAILLGQVFGSWFVASGYIHGVIGAMLFSALIGLYSSYTMQRVPIAAAKVKFYKNLFKDSWFMYKDVTAIKGVRINIHTISWFWAVGAINTTQLPIMTQRYFGGNGHVFSIILALFSLGIGLGSLICAKISNHRVVHAYVALGVVGMAICMSSLLLLHRQEVAYSLSAVEFFSNLNGLVVLILCFLNGIFAGFYSVTCYSELQLITPLESRSQVISANNILNGFYIVAATLISSICLIFMSVWWLIMLIAICNLIFACVYARVIKLRWSLLA